MSFSIPMTSKPPSAKWRTASDPMSPPAPVMMAVGKRLLSSDFALRWKFVPLSGGRRGRQCGHAGGLARERRAQQLEQLGAERVADRRAHEPLRLLGQRARREVEVGPS